MRAARQIERADLTSCNFILEFGSSRITQNAFDCTQIVLYVVLLGLVRALLVRLSIQTDVYRPYVSLAVSHQRVLSCRSRFRLFSHFM